MNANDNESVGGTYVEREELAQLRLDQRRFRWLLQQFAHATHKTVSKALTAIDYFIAQQDGFDRTASAARKEKAPGTTRSLLKQTQANDDPT